MRHVFWLLLIAFSGSALCGGYLSGRAAVPHFAPAPPVSVDSRAIPQTDELAHDEFAPDEAVTVESARGNPGDDARLALVIVNAGHSVALESPFLSLGVPVTIVVEPRAPAARRIASLALQRGALVYVQAHGPFEAAQIRSLHAAFPLAAGIAMHLTGEDEALPLPLLRTLRDLNWGVFDECGESRVAARSAAAAGVPYAARTITVDDHEQRAFVAYMLRQAVHLARGGTAIVMARAFPGTLQAFEDLLARASRDGVRIVGVERLGRPAMEARAH